MSNRIQDLPEDERPREKMLARGASALTDAELLALFFRVGGAGLNAIELGRKLIEEFGSLKAVSRASLDDFQKVPGIGPAKATELAAAFEIGKRVAKEHFSAVKVDSPEAVFDLLGQEMGALAQESLRVVLLNTRHHLIKVVEVSLGSLNETVAHPREIVKAAVSHSAFAFIMVHNHPSGDPSPSQADRTLTRKLVEAAELMDLRFLDHVIIGAPSQNGSDAYFSFREMGLM